MSFAKILWAFFQKVVQVLKVLRVPNTLVSQIAIVEHKVETLAFAIVQSFLMRSHSHLFPSDDGTLGQETKVP